MTPLSSTAGWHFLALASLMTGCAGDTASAVDAAGELAAAETTPDTLPEATPETAADSANGPAQTVYVSFILNVHDWVYPADSIATVGHVVDLHEQYHQPVDIYLTDPMLRIFLAQAPDLVARLKSSPYVTICHHVRPPTPYYSGFDWAGLAGMSDHALAAKLLAYEEHAIDLATGQPTSAAGGYELMKTTFGYPPYVVTQAEGASRVSQALAAVYRAKGAKFTLVHSDSGTEWGTQANGLWMRPETVEVKVYERLAEVDFASVLLAPALAQVGDKRPAFINLKWHDDNFHSSATPWKSVYYDDQGVMRPPPWDPSAIGPQTLKTQAQIDVQWRRYEAALQAVSAHPETYTIAGIRDFARMAGLE